MEKSAGIPPATSRPPTILVVEDEVLIRMAIAEALRDRSYVVAEASNADDARGLVDAGIEPDVLLTDVRMPGAVDGLELAIQLKARLPQLIVVVASGDADPQRATALGFRFFGKPYDFAAVMQAISEELESR